MFAIVIESTLNFPPLLSREHHGLVVDSRPTLLNETKAFFNAALADGLDVDGLRHELCLQPPRQGSVMKPCRLLPVLGPGVDFNLQHAQNELGEELVDETRQIPEESAQHASEKRPH